MINSCDEEFTPEQIKSHWFIKQNMPQENEIVHLFDDQKHIMNYYTSLPVFKDKNGFKLQLLNS